MRQAQKITQDVRKGDITLVSASRQWLNQMATEHHYLHKGLPNQSCAFGWAVEYKGEIEAPDGKPYGFIIFATPHFQKMRGEFGFEGLPTKWQVLMLSRLWCHDDMPRNSETCVIAKALSMVQKRWLEVHPPPFPDEPYHILKVISYCDTAYHLGTIYKASNFRFAGARKSKTRINSTRGHGAGSVLHCYIKDLPYPRWQYEAGKCVPMQLPLQIPF
jgi:hypothetical protein